jgi:uncharacterized protein (TIGR03905 family)
MADIIQYKTKGTCSRQINITVDGGIVTDVSFVGGCSGNTQGISKLIKGMPVDEVIKRLEGIRCGLKSTSCPDQLAEALKNYNINKNYSIS